MSIANYADFMVHLGKMVTFEGDNPGDASIGTLQSVLLLAETRIYREVQTGYNLGVLSGSTTSNTLAVPADFRSPSNTLINGVPLEPVPSNFLLEQLSIGGSGDVKLYSLIGNSFQFYPSAGTGASVTGTYYKAYPALDDTTYASNALVNVAPDLFLFACMVEAAPMYGFQDQIQLWEAKYQSVRDALNSLDMRTAYSSGRMKRKASTQLIG